MHPPEPGDQRVRADRHRGWRHLETAQQRQGSSSSARSAPGPSASTVSVPADPTVLRQRERDRPVGGPRRPPHATRAEPDRGVTRAVRQGRQRPAQVQRTCHAVCSLEHRSMPLRAQFVDNSALPYRQTTQPMLRSPRRATPRVVAGVALIATLAMVAVPGSVGSRGPSPTLPSTRPLPAGRGSVADAWDADDGPTPRPGGPVSRDPGRGSMFIEPPREPSRSGSDS